MKYSTNTGFDKWKIWAKFMLDNVELKWQIWTHTVQESISAIFSEVDFQTFFKFKNWENLQKVHGELRNIPNL